MELLRERYEISVWEDKVTTVEGVSHFSEQKLLVIGADGMDSPFSAFEPQLKEESNGLSTLTFKMLLHIHDRELGELIDNPYISYLVPERKVKVFFRDKWRDLIIKDITENKSSHTNTYICKDLFVNELSKSGGSLEFSTELENNLGTIEELAMKGLEGTDYIVGDIDLLREKKEEGLYAAVTSTALTATEVETGASKVIPQGKTVYLFYSIFSNLVDGQTEDNLQFLYPETIELNDSGLITTPNSLYEINSATVSKQSGNWIIANAIIINENKAIEGIMRGLRYVKLPLTKYDAKLDRYVSVYKKDGNDVYGFTETRYNSPAIVLNLTTNGKHFRNTAGWSGDELTWKTHAAGDISTLKSYLFATMTKDKKLTNTGLRDHSHYLRDGIAKGESFVFLVRAFTGTSTAPNSTLTGNLRPHFVVGSTAVTASAGTLVTVEGTQYYRYIMKAQATVAHQSILNGSGASIALNASSAGTYWVEEFWCFSLAYDGQEKIITPFTIEVDSMVETVYYYYDPNSSYTGPDDIEYLDKLLNPSPLYVLQYDGLMEKRRMIELSKSNRFNFIQSLAELFECWPIFEIEHETTGHIRVVNGKPVKKVHFKENRGKVNPIGITYGIDLLDITRSLTSNQIVTKLLVYPNSNQFAEYGYCAIADSKENAAKENFLFNFTYFINQGLIDIGALQNDLYSTSLGLGLLTVLREKNLEVGGLIEERSKILTALDRLEADKVFYETSRDSAAVEQANQLNQLFSYSGKTTVAGVVTWLNANPTHLQAKAVYSAYLETGKIKAANDALATKTIAQIATEKGKETQIRDTLLQLEADKKEVYDAFHKKYFRFIQEGTWIDENYFDPTLYYLDAEQILRDSAFPEIKYTIGMVSLAALPGYEYRQFELGDITTIEDPEFFGYVWVDGVKTPYREKVLVSDITYNFDSPEKDTVTIQNYKTKFQDLFQRITATTQSLQLTSGSYDRAASVVQPNRTIDPQVLQNSLLINRQLVYSAQNEAVTMDSTGITAVDLDDTKRAVRLTSKGLFYTKDGGDTWPVGMNADGVATSSLTAGTIYTDNITISHGGIPTFRWDSIGLSAYHFTEAGLNPGRFVRFDQYGIYGINGIAGYVPNPDDPESDIWDNANFAVTWKGFNLHTRRDGEDGYVQISTENLLHADIVVNQLGVDRVELGRLDTDLYGLRLRNAANKVTLTANTDGDLILAGELYINEDIQNLIAIGNLSYPGSKFGEFTYIDALIPSGTNLAGETLYIFVNGDYELSTDPFAEEGTVYYYQKEEIFNANQKFKVFKDGTVLAEDGLFKGRIEATSGFFTGEILATSGFFRGTIEANSGKVGSAIITENGLQIRDGEFSITNNPTEEEGLIEFLKFADEKLIIAGDSEFSGRLMASSGQIASLYIEENALYASLDGEERNFEITGDGTLTVKRGTIGGILINENSLQSQNFDSELGIGFRFDDEGHLIANSIELGGFATIKNYLQLGDNTFLFNSLYEDPSLQKVAGEVFRAKNLRFYDDGTANFGAILIDGDNSSISATNAWSLTPSLASFSNISASGSISSMVFETNTVQGMGGHVIFKHSAKILNTTCVENGTTPETYTITFDIDLENQSYFNVGDIVLVDTLGNNSTERLTGNITNALANTSLGVYSLTVFSDEICDTDAQMLVNIGASFGDNWVIGVNASNTRFMNILEPNAITFSSVSQDASGDILYTPRIILGELGEIAGFGAETHGLYAEAAYLTGTLTTRTFSEEMATYAGVNTISGVGFNPPVLEGEEGILGDDSRIVFWAGSEDNTPINIQKSPFQVTERGTLYAKSGYFTESVFIRSTIQASNIETAEIHGLGDTPALRVYSTGAESLQEGGIEFLRETVATMRLNQYGINLLEGAYYIDSEPVITFNREGILSDLTISLNNRSALHAFDTGNNYTIKNIVNDIVTTQLTLDQTGKFELIGKKSSGVLGNLLTVDSPRSDFSESLGVQGNLVLGDEAAQVLFQKVDEGYDIYIT